ncbi:hypothetical protein K438DRAFT_2037573 [Mycena galopus ATCC 62051]|nr:hypothetical protein K438DRAFT_2037573 [Mycena galopus ATCC 62051]
MSVPQAAPETPLQPPPAYGVSSTGVRHRFPLVDKRGKQWGSLILESGARSPSSIPLFYEDDTIYGSVEMDVDKADSMRSVTVKAAGSIVTGHMADDSTKFWKVSTCLWTRKTASPDVGRCAWPFSIQIPNEVVLSQMGGQPSTFRLPENFLERQTRVTILYEISVTVSRGIFRSDSYFKTRFRYVPCTRPNPPSALRQQAYGFNVPLRGPRDDTEGWETSVTAMAHGHLFGTQQAVVQCTLSLARPLCYTRGSVIPCWLTLESGNTQALDLYAAPDAVVLHLRRCVRHRNASPMATQSVDGEQSLTTLSLAAWWPRPEYDSSEYTRTLEGELRVPADLISSSAMGAFSLSYTVDLGPPDCVGFTPSDSKVLISLPVEIATMYPSDMPRPVVYAPPSYATFTPDSGPGDAFIFSQRMGHARN